MSIVTISLTSHSEIMTKFVFVKEKNFKLLSALWVKGEKLLAAKTRSKTFGWKEAEQWRFVEDAFFGNVKSKLASCSFKLLRALKLTEKLTSSETKKVLFD